MRRKSLDNYVNKKQFKNENSKKNVKLASLNNIVLFNKELNMYFI